jgi:hypothetical protein
VSLCGHVVLPPWRGHRADGGHNDAARRNLRARSAPTRQYRDGPPPAGAQCGGGSQPSSTGGRHSVPTVREPATHEPSSGWGNFVCCSLSWMP